MSPEVHTLGDRTAHKQAIVLHLGGACWLLWPKLGGQKPDTTEGRSLSHLTREKVDLMLNQTRFIS